jgi:hypothetical protein
VKKLERPAHKPFIPVFQAFQAHTIIWFCSTFAKSANMTDISISFPGLRDDCEMQIHSADFTTTLASPQYGWMPEDEEAAEDPFPAQLLAAYQIFIQFFVVRTMKAWVHLGAEMQAGKTGVVAGLIRLVLANFSKLRIVPTNIFVITGMSDKAWKKQTKERLIPDVRDGVEHNSPQLTRIAANIKKIAERNGGELRNILVIIDESHIAASDNNRPNSIIFNTIKECSPREKWVENNIRILTISATDPAKVLDITYSPITDVAVVRLQTTPEYQSVETLMTEERIIAIHGDIHTDWGIDCIRGIIDVQYDNEHLYHILRPKAVNYKRSYDRLCTEFPDADIMTWDSSSRGSCGTGYSIGTDASSSVSELDINDILAEKPERTTFIILKNMFYAAKTMNDEYVGILYDRVGGKDDTNLQSLLGRACGYGKSKRTFIFTSQQTVDNYISCWKELCSKKGFPPQVRDIPAKLLNKKMQNVNATQRRAIGTQLYTVSTSSLISGGGSASAAAAAMPRPAPRQTANEDNFESEWHEFSTFEQLRADFPDVTEKTKNTDGFYLSSTSKSLTVLTYDSIMGMKNGKKTANMNPNKMIIGHIYTRHYVGYKNIEDPSSAVFFVRRVTRIA